MITKKKNHYLGIRAQVSDAHAMAFSFPHQATALIQQKIGHSYKIILLKSEKRISRPHSWVMYVTRANFRKVPIACIVTSRAGSVK